MSKNRCKLSWTKNWANRHTERQKRNFTFLCSVSYIQALNLHRIGVEGCLFYKLFTDTKYFHEVLYKTLSNTFLHQYIAPKKVEGKRKIYTQYSNCHKKIRYSLPCILTMGISQTIFQEEFTKKRVSTAKELSIWDDHLKQVRILNNCAQLFHFLFQM